MTTMTNQEFADSVGIHFTMASRLRSGDRRPGLATVIAVIRAYSLDCDEVVAWLEAIEQGPKESGEWLRAHIFNEPIEPAA